jgi:hypothetical protein
MIQYLNRPGGEVVNASVCKTDTHGFESRPGLIGITKASFVDAFVISMAIEIRKGCLLF